MIVCTTDTVPDRTVLHTLGLVRGSTVRCMHVGQDIVAMLRNLVGGEIEEYTKMLAEAREEALDRMMADAAALGANAVLGVRYATSDIMAGAAEILVYGTGVVLSEEPH